MKNKALFFIITMLLCFMSYSQEAIWGSNAIVSPEVNSNNTVTFQILAPEAQKIELTGDFLPTHKKQTPMGEVDEPGKVLMDRNEKGLWTYTTAAPLAPELYSYSLIVDGVKVTDPNNPYMVRDVASVTSIFIIGGGQADLYKVNDVPHGTVTRRWYNSPTLDMNRRMTIYTPVGYETNEQKYPVLYLLHGAGGDEEAWITLGRTAQILDNLIAQGKSQPMIVVMTNDNAGQQAAPGQSPRGMYKPSFMGDTRMDDAFELAFPDVVRFIEKNYRVFTDKAHRAIAGLSMGGFHSFHISKQHPDMFDYVGLFSAAMIPPNGNVKSDIYSNTDEKLKELFAQEPKLYYVAIGSSDFLYEANKEFRNTLDASNYPYEYLETSGGHIWKNWRIYLIDFLPRLF